MKEIPTFSAFDLVKYGCPELDCPGLARNLKSNSAIFVLIDDEGGQGKRETGFTLQTCELCNTELARKHADIEGMASFGEEIPEEDRPDIVLEEDDIFFSFPDHPKKPKPADLAESAKSSD